MTTAQDIIAACEAEWEAHQSDCSGFAKAVAGHFGIVLNGLADDIVGEIAASSWTVLKDGPSAATSAGAGQFVLAALKGADQVVPDTHGHVVVVVQGPLANGLYPTAYWGQLGGIGCQAKTTNWAWRAGDRDKVVYAAMTPVPPVATTA